jgi:preprotein translocase subunit SecY
MPSYITPGMPMEPTERISLKTIVFWLIAQTVLIIILAIFLVVMYLDNREMRIKIEQCNNAQIQALKDVVTDFKVYLDQHEKKK